MRCSERSIVGLDSWQQITISSAGKYVAKAMESEMVSDRIRTRVCNLTVTLVRWRSVGTWKDNRAPKLCLVWLPLV